ncbi:MAG: metal-dependent transcriptional regulator [Erysipelotrichaceae bacterium]|nr:metal-dependent transcriptional regulator [Erysipelotrichaceae bacterium]
MTMNQSQEDYLEAIYVLSKEDENVRMSDVAKHLGVSKPSVNKAINLLQEKGYLIHQHYGTILMTDEGKTLAKKVYDRHKVIKRFFVDILKVDEAVAEDEACKVEHCIGEDTIEKLKEYVESVLN